MADVIVKLKVMPVGVDVDLDKLSEACKAKIEEKGGMVHKAEQEEVAFGLKSITFTFLGDEKKINVDEIEASLKELPELSTMDVIDVRRAFG